jgi:glycosyltransferase involved in cell wall biosynthesis
MRLVVDGLIFQKDPHGGVARLYREILPRICDLAPELQVTLFIDGPVRAALPEHPRILVRRAPAVKQTLRVRGVWGKALYPFRRLASRAWSSSRRHWLRNESNAIWHSTYYTLPGTWNGPQVVTVYDMIHEQFPQYFADPLDDLARRQKKRCIDQAAAVICISAATKHQVEKFYALETPRVRVIPLACSPLFRRLETPVEPVPGLPFESYLLYVGRRVHYKNFQALLEGFSAWEGRGEAGLVLVGEPLTRSELKRLEETGLEGRVRLFSGVDDATLCQLYNSALALVFPSLEEGFGIPLLEAMACGCPVVASRIPSTLEVAANCPIYFDLEQPETLLSALDQSRLVERSDARVQAGLERVKLFSWESNAQQTLEVYQDVWIRAANSDGND